MIHRGKGHRVVIVALRAATRALFGFRAVPAPVREELAQEAALRTWQAESVREPAAFAVRVARRLAIDWLRRRAEEPPPDLGAVPEAVAWQGRVEARMTLRVLETVLAAAPPLHQETLRLLFVEEHTLEEVLEERLGQGGDRARERDLLYKRRTRALLWIRAAFAEAA